jgi:hypothetical protein
MQWIAGIDVDNPYSELAAQAIEGMPANVPIRVCGLAHLRAMKQAAGRPRDLDDLRYLPEAETAEAAFTARAARRICSDSGPEHSLRGCLGLLQLALDQVEAGVPEAGVGEVDADDRAQLLG